MAVAHDVVVDLGSQWEFAHLVNGRYLHIPVNNRETAECEAKWLRVNTRIEVREVVVSDG